MYMLLLTIMILGVCFSFGPAIIRHVPGPQPGFECITISNVAWYNQGATARCDSNNILYKFAFIIPEKERANAYVFKGTDCALDFTANTRSGYDFAYITRVIVDVLEYKPAVKCDTEIPAPADIHNVLYVKIKKPLNKAQSFDATHYITASGMREFENWKIVKDNPEDFRLRINAAEEGLYCLRVKISSNASGLTNDKEQYSLVKESTWFYFAK